MKAAERNKGIVEIHFRSPITFTLFFAGLFLVLFNYRFWHETVAAFWQGNLQDALFLFSLCILLLIFYAAVLLMVPGKRLMLTVTGLLFPIGAAASFSADSFGIAIDQEMIRSLVNANRGEATSMISPRLLLYTLGLGVLPLFLVGGTRMPSLPLRSHLRQRGMFLAAACTFAAIVMMAFPSRFSAFASDHKHLHYFSVPGAAVHGAIQFARSSIQGIGHDRPGDLAGAPRRIEKAAGAKPLLVFLVIGETARHANFQLGGYALHTNPRLSGTGNLLYFRNVESCGTSTVVSLPCMFSPLGRERFNVAKAQYDRNALDTLTKAGIHTEWRANNSGSRIFSERVRSFTYLDRGPAHLCNDESCFDELLLEGLEERIAGLAGDTVIAFHQMGSHGPAYFKRYPPAFEIFKPACKSNALDSCSLEEVRNAYDNTILYTDHVLARKIEILKKASRFDTALLYVSDHGESLGEKGVFLHGAPYPVAPDEQKRIPLIFWMSDGYAQRMKLDQACLQRQLPLRFSHDNIYHTLLGATETRSDAYRSGMDMLAPCRVEPQ
ncbi:MAG TPA: phosphoethanolamine--lipid A transferase [Noviherbaspirillum sp.]|jgi:lipid A ethanolaminephosphotransferase|uniref:phosphoethanolamine transferase n=1 Tax=Noviherbaspirillum sp. TaxID=1926288 RepID=UPI002DDC9409|nr:phosphoethanolamine--lipid A transferase [Noviherbaspirillum sp.]HEV2612922.1 phosphoethanolamine--lipid A transferase [Noviherbaspirillum sp.]